MESTERRYSLTPRILSIADVELPARPELAEALTEFYVELLDLDPVPGWPAETGLAFRGWPRSGPRVIFHWAVAPPARPPRRDVLIQVDSLRRLGEALTERDWPFDRLRGLSFFDDRLLLADPACYTVELVAYHPI